MRWGMREPLILSVKKGDKEIFVKCILFLGATIFCHKIMADEGSWTGINCQGAGKYKDLCVRVNHEADQRQRKDLGLPLTTAQGTILDRRDVEKAERERQQKNQSFGDQDCSPYKDFRARVEDQTSEPKKEIDVEESIDGPWAKKVSFLWKKDQKTE